MIRQGKGKEGVRPQELGRDRALWGDGGWGGFCVNVHVKSATNLKLRLHQSPMQARMSCASSCYLALLFDGAGGEGRQGNGVGRGRYLWSDIALSELLEFFF